MITRTHVINLETLQNFTPVVFRQHLPYPLISYMLKEGVAISKTLIGRFCLPDRKKSDVQASNTLLNHDNLTVKYFITAIEGLKLRE